MTKREFKYLNHKFIIHKGVKYFTDKEKSIKWTWVSKRLVRFNIK